MASTHSDSHSPSHRALVDVAANDSFSHESPNEHTAHIIDDGYLEGVTAELTVFRHVVVSKWSKVVHVRVFDSVRVFICAFIIFTSCFVFQIVMSELVIRIHCKDFKDVLFSPTSRMQGERCSHVRDFVAMLQQ